MHHGETSWPSCLPITINTRPVENANERDRDRERQCVRKRQFMLFTSHHRTLSVRPALCPVLLSFVGLLPCLLVIPYLFHFFCLFVCFVSSVIFLVSVSCSRYLSPTLKCSAICPNALPQSDGYHRLLPVCGLTKVEKHWSGRLPVFRRNILFPSSEGKT